jgi:hypothetical protein
MKQSIRINQWEFTKFLICNGLFEYGFEYVSDEKSEMFYIHSSANEAEENYIEITFNQNQNVSVSVYSGSGYQYLLYESSINTAALSYSEIVWKIIINLAGYGLNKKSIHPPLTTAKLNFAAKWLTSASSLYGAYHSDNDEQYDLLNIKDKIVNAQYLKDYVDKLGLDTSITPPMTVQQVLDYTRAYYAIKKCQKNKNKDK